MNRPLYIAGPGKARPAHRLLRHVNVGGGWHAHSLRRLLGIGRWNFYVVSHRRGWINHANASRSWKCPCVQEGGQA